MNLPPKTQALILNGAPKGDRNNTLLNICCQLRDSGMTQDRAYDEAEVWALRNGLGHKEAEGCIRSVFSRPARERWEPKARYGLNGHNGLTIVKNDMPVPPMPTSVEETPVAMFLSAAFELGENINICRGIKEGDKERPNGTGETKTREEWLKTFEDGGLVDWQGSAVGVYVSINPNNGKGRSQEHVVKWRHVLIEFDDSTLEEQWKIIKKSGLPTSCIIKSGGRSLHAWVRIDASNKAEFDERVAFIFKNLEHGKPDLSTKDAGRLSRLPGAMRTTTGKQQELVECGAPELTYMEWMEGKIYGDIPEPYKWDDLVKFDENADPTVLLGKRWLCRGGSSLWVGSSGLGKSVLCLQAAMTWGAARNLFGITSHNKGLKSLIVQAENDEGDVAEALQGILTALNLSPDELEQVKSNIVIVRDCTSTGECFVDRMRRLVDKHKPHLVWVDPLLAFIGGDLSSQETASGFLRNMLNPLALSAGFAWMLMHHTPKPMRDGTSYQGHDKAYSGFGSSELTNWARSVLTLGPCGQNEDGTYVYKLEVSKRGKRSGLHTGKTARDCIATSVQPFVYLKHADKGMAWIEADAPEKKKPGPKAEEVDWSRCNVMPCSWADLVRWVEKRTGKSGTTATRYIANGKEQDYLCEVNGMYQLNKAKNDQPF